MMLRLRNNWLIVLLAGLALVIHFWHLDQPSRIVSDEFYFVHDAERYLTGRYYVDAHPPLGKMQIAALMTFSGSHPLTWRMINAVDGAILIVVVWWIAWRLTGRRRAANIAAGLAFLDGFLLTESRLGLINIPYILYAFTAVGAILEALRRPRRIGWLLLAGLMIGLALSVKWLALFILAPACLIWLFPRLGRWTAVPRPAWLMVASVGCLLVVPIFIYTAIWHAHFAWLGWPDETVRTNVYLWLYHTAGYTGDAYRQPWWGWPLLWQPFLYWRQQSGMLVSSIWSMGNPFVWWTGLPVMLAAMWQWRRRGHVLLVLFAIASWLPFVFIRRDMFSYHAIPFGLWLFMIIASVADSAWERYRRWVISYLILATVVWIWFLPWYLNIPISQSQDRLRRWLPSWQVQTPSPGE